MSILKTKLYLFIYAFIGTLCLTSCSFNLGFEPTILYKFSAELKYARDNNVMQKEPEIHLFNNYENMYQWFDTYTYPYGGRDKELAFNEILNNVDFQKYNLFGYMQYDGTGSIIRTVSLDKNKITFYSYMPDIVTDDIAYKWYIFEINKEYSLEDIEIEFKKMSVKQKVYLVNNYSCDYYF